METLLGTQSNCLTIDLSEDEVWTTIKKTNRWIQSWSWNELFIGLNFL